MSMLVGLGDATPETMNVAARGTNTSALPGIRDSRTYWGQYADNCCIPVECCNLHTLKLRLRLTTATGY